ncbi:type II secretion system protein M [Sphingomonas ginsenosidivorax]|uniref:Type II secretion system protein M n=1 Tax=Sphingomonas ginsenosidivorax TaxID=862135 RepID=A0A5C6UBF2_9SPHN|nr:type II secretion system protein GspM [Sphingomonas ginsenosidivorax]TXC70133.1 type II secretion system protein M [Sphingomonas ginsenosidivorax]
MTALRSWFDARAPREKKLLVVMAALAVLTLIWGAIIRPVGDGLSSARERHADAVTRLGETQAQVAALKAIQRGRPRPLTGTLADVVRIEADQAGFTLTSLDQDGANVRVAIQSARPAAVVAWLARLERIGILVDSAAMTDTGNKSVGVTLVLKARAA